MRSYLVQRPIVFNRSSKQPHEVAPSEWRVFVLPDAHPALAFGAGGDQVPEPQFHLGVVAHGALLVAIALMALHVGLEVQAVRSGDKVASVAALLRRFWPCVLRLCQILFPIKRQSVSHDRLTQGHFDGADTQERIIIAIEDMLMIDPQPEVHHVTRAQADRQEWEQGQAGGRRGELVAGVQHSSRSNWGQSRGRPSPQTEIARRSRHRCDSSTALITSEKAVGSTTGVRMADDHRGTAWLATREFDTHPSHLEPDIFGGDDHTRAGDIAKPVINDPGPLVLCRWRGQPGSMTALDGPAPFTCDGRSTRARRSPVEHSSRRVSRAKTELPCGLFAMTKLHSLVPSVDTNGEADLSPIG